MQTLALHCNKDAPSTIALDSAHDIFNQFFILSVPGGAILCGPEHLREPANSMAEHTEPHSIDRFRIIGLNLTPAQEPVKCLHEAAPHSRVRREINKLFGGGGNRD